MKILGNIIKSKSDKRTYKAIQLQNQLTCLIISDQQAEKSAAALSVAVGSLKDPLEAQGLAHYLQHMLFMGTHKYPLQNDYSTFITKNSGSTNAYTDQTQTNYHFQVASNAFVGALDRFSHFFIAPLMSDSSSQRQLNAVHSQHSKNLQNDTWRSYQLSKHLAIPKHPYNKFSTGNKSTLSNPNLREMLFNFYNTTYSSNIMNLVVYGREDADALAQIIAEKFAGIQNKNYHQTKMDSIPFDERVFGKLVKYVPIKDRKVLQLEWILKDRLKDYKNSPGKYIAHLVGHQAKGSLLDYLISQGLATELSAGSYDYYQCFTKFSVRISLTEKGLNNINSIIEQTLGYIEMLKEVGPQEWVFKELQNVYRMKFQFLDKKKGINYCSSLANNLHLFPAEQILAYNYFMEEWKPQSINNYLNQLQLNNLLIFAQSQKFQPQCNLAEPIYGTKYTIAELGNLQKVSGHVYLPKPNPFLPKDLTIFALGQEQYPMKFISTEKMEVFFKKDHRFELPKGIINIRIYFDGINTPHQQVSRILFKQMLNQKLRDLVYMAEMAQLSTSLSFTTYHLDLQITGFRDSILKFVSLFLNEIINFMPDDQTLFENLKEKQVKAYKNFFMNTPYQITYNTQVQALREGNQIPPLQNYQTSQLITLNDVITFAKSWKNKIFTQAYISGNFNEDNAKVIVNQLQKALQQSNILPKSSIGSIRAVVLPTNKIYGIEETLVSKDETNSSVIVHFQYQKLKITTKLLQDICVSFIKEPAFDYLRTKQQLGYVVMCLPDDHRGVLGISILVQSNIKTSYQLISYIDKFLNETLAQKIKQLDQTTFDEYKKSLLASKMEKDKNLANETQRFWTEVVRHSYQFRRKQQQIELLPQITLDQFKNFLNTVFYNNTRRLQIHTISNKQAQSNSSALKERLAKNSQYTVFSDVRSFKKKMTLYPDFYSHL